MGYDKWDRPAIPTAEGEEAEIIPLAESLEETEPGATAESGEELELETEMNFAAGDVRREVGTYVSRMLEDDDAFGTLAMEPKERDQMLKRISQDPELFSTVNDLRTAVQKGRMNPTKAMQELGSAFARVRDKEKMKYLRGKLGKK